MSVLQRLLVIWLSVLSASVVGLPFSKDEITANGGEEVVDSGSAGLARRALGDSKKLLIIQLSVVLGLLAILCLVGGILWARWVREEEEALMAEDGVPRNALSPLPEDPKENLEDDSEPRRIQLHDGEVPSDTDLIQTQRSGNIPILMPSNERFHTPTNYDAEPEPRPASPVSPVSAISRVPTNRTKVSAEVPKTNGGMI